LGRCQTRYFVTQYIDESVYLSNRIVVLSHSTTVREIVSVDLPFPRDRIDTKDLAEFSQLRAHVYRLIKRERAACGRADRRGRDARPGCRGGGIGRAGST
jgi:ABC-type nitrate/sulfonate/bicarbonate transport system ATPase subunit